MKQPLRVTIEVPDTPQCNQATWNRVQAILSEAIESLTKTTPEDCELNVIVGNWKGKFEYGLLTPGIKEIEIGKKDLTQ